MEPMRLFSNEVIAPTPTISHRKRRAGAALELAGTSSDSPLVFAIEVRINTRLAEAPEAGKTIFQYDPSATGAEAYRLLADEYLLRAGVIERAGRPES